MRRIPVERGRELRRSVLRPHETVEQLAAHETPGTVAYGAFAGGELVGVGMITPSEEFRIRGMAVDPAHRGEGVGTEILQQLLTYAAQHGAPRVWCNARTPARSLYERAGFSAISDEFELPCIGPHYVMERRESG